MIIRSHFSSADFSVSLSLPSLSPTTKWYITSKPRRFSSFDRYAAFVFIVCPNKSSVPTDKIQQRIISLLKKTGKAAGENSNHLCKII